MSRCLAIAEDRSRFVLGTEWHLRLFDPEGKELWQKPVPGVAWAVNLSADGRFVVAALGDGTYAGTTLGMATNAWRCSCIPMRNVGSSLRPKVSSTLLPVPTP